MLDQVIDLLKVVAPVGGGLWAFYLYIDQKREKNWEQAKDAALRTETSSLESRRPFLELKLKTYIQTAEIVGELVSEPIDSPEWNAAEKRFWAFYWSQLSIVESKKIEDIMIELGKCVEHCRASKDDSAKARLKDQSYDLAHQIRREIQSDWHVPAMDGQKRLAAIK
jgi:hypothetical protein